MRSKAVRTNGGAVSGSMESGSHKANALIAQLAMQPRPKSSTLLTRQKNMTAWIRLGETIQQFCDQPARDCSVCLVSAERLVVRESTDSRPVELSLSGTVITLRHRTPETTLSVLLANRKLPVLATPVASSFPDSRHSGVICLDC